MQTKLKMGGEVQVDWGRENTGERNERKITGNREEAENTLEGGKC